MSDDTSIIWIITGPFQVGKTHFCHNLVNEAQRRGYKLAGVICPPVFEEQNKTAITIEDLKSHQRKTLATKRTTETEGLLTEHWVFDEEVLLWGNRVLGETIGCDLLLIDELGPLEFNRGQGWLNGLQAIDNGEYKIAVVVIRPVLVETAQKRWPNAIVIDFQARLKLEETRHLVEQVLLPIEQK
ncbi:MAG: nucleoside-triphosphatase [Anaerolineaceae bacterium]|nr:nucleoside-triphosphatase [Anaerolineaceae bacterium]